MLPQEFIDMLAATGYAPFADLPHTLTDTPPEVSVRFNPLRRCDAPSASDGSVPWAPGIYLAGRPAFIFDPRIHQGVYYVQDAASMFIHHVVSVLCSGASSPLLCLDACAAPGGKTTAVMQALPSGSVMVANEYVPLRAEILRENVAKWGSADISVISADTSLFRSAPGLFDLIIADVPCSGEGMMRKDPGAVEQWTSGLVRSCAARQREIVSNLWEALAPGGHLIYSTCTFNTTENEEMVRFMADTLGAIPVAIPVDPVWNISPGIGTTLPVYRFIPGITRGEGLFMAVLSKPAGTAAPEVRKTAARQKAAPRPSNNAAKATAWLRTDNPLEIIEQQNTLFARSASPLAIHLPAQWRPQTEIAKIKGNDLVPTQQLALSRCLARGIFPETETDREQAVAYIKGLSISLPSSPRGIVLLTYQGNPLGFVKNIGNRANNLYPSQWRIRTTPPSPLPPLPF